jgi:transposase
MQTVHIIRHKVLVEGLSVQQVARDLGLSRTTVYKYLERPEPRRGAQRSRPRPVLDATASRIDALLVEWQTRTTAKQRLTAARIHRQLRTEGYAISDRSVRQYLRQKKLQEAEAAIPHREPGLDAFLVIKPSIPLSQELEQVLVLVGQLQNHEALSWDREHMNPHEVMEHRACRRGLDALAFLVRKGGRMLLEGGANAIL